MLHNLVSIRYAKLLARVCKDELSHDNVVLLNEIFLHHKLRIVLMAHMNNNSFFALLEKTTPLSSGIKNFLRLVRAKGRFLLVLNIFDCYLDARAESEGKVRAKLVSGTNIGEKALAGIQQRFSTQIGKELLTDCRIDSSMVGGFALYGRSFMVDATAIGRLHAFASALISKVENA